jgi:opacity protein-like surface antigen
MRVLKLVVLIVLVLLCASSAFAQRKRQIEIYAGAAFPLGPDFFKEYAKVGLSGNAQYVIFPSPKIGITFNVGYERFSTDNEKFTDALSQDLTGETASFWVDQGFDINPSAEISSSLIRFGGGIRPYLTPPEAGTQFFLLGQVNFNIIKNDFSANQLPFEYDQFNDELTVLTFDDKEYEEAIEENDENKVGFGLGAGVEIPAGESFNIVLQGLFNIILTKDESTSFVGATAGLVF